MLQTRNALRAILLLQLPLQPLDFGAQFFFGGRREPFDRIIRFVQRR